MSGFTRITQERELYALSLETPCMNFALPEPTGDGQPTFEQRYHADAARAFEAILAPLDPGLSKELDELRTRYAKQAQLIPWSNDLPLLAGFEKWALDRYRSEGGGAFRMRLRVKEPAWSEVEAVAWGGIELAFAALPSQEVVERLERDVNLTIDRLRTAHARRQRGALRPKTATADFHYVSWPDGAVEDRNGPGDGTRLPALLDVSPLPPAAASELATAIAILFVAAEQDGVIHPCLERSDVLIDERGAVTVDGFGQKRRCTPSAPEAPRDFNTFERDRQPDWIAIQRHSLGALLTELLARDSATVAPEVGALLSGLTSNDPVARPSALAAWRTLQPLANGRAQLTAWLTRLRGDDASVLPASAPPTTITDPPARRAPTQVPRRLLAGGFGILEPCIACGRPALAGVGIDREERARAGPSRLRPDCCFRPRQRRNDRIARVTLLVLLVGALIACALLLRRCLR